MVKRKKMHWRYFIFDANNSLGENTRVKKKKSSSLKKKRICREEEFKVSISWSTEGIGRMKNLGCLLLYL